VGAAAHALMPLYKLIEAHVLAATRIHGDDTTVPAIAKGKTDTGRLPSAQGSMSTTSTPASGLMRVGHPDGSNRPAAASMPPCQWAVCR